MTPQADIIRRRADGSIDTDFYVARAAEMRMAARRDAPRCWLDALWRLLRRG